MRTENIKVQASKATVRRFSRRRMIGCETRRFLFLMSVLLWPAVLVGCSSSISQHETAATAYPQQSRAELPRQAQPGFVPVAVQNVSASGQVAGTALTGLTPPRSASSAPAAPNFAAAQTNLSAAAAQPTSLSPTPVVDGAAAKPAAPPPEEFDAAASAYPSVALFDLIRQSANSTPQARPANPPLLSDSATPAPAAGQTAAAAPPVQSAAANSATPPPAQSATANNAPAAPATSTSDDFDPAASAYPSVALFDLFRNNKPNQ